MADFKTIKILLGAKANFYVGARTYKLSKQQVNVRMGPVRLTKPT